MRVLLWPVAGAVGIGLLAATRVEVSPDVDTWAAGPLAGEVVPAVEDADGVLLVGTRDGLVRLEPTGGLQDLPVDGRVNALAADAEAAWVGTDDGVVRLTAEAATAGPGTLADGLADVPVHALDASGGAVVAGTESGLHARTGSGTWERLWPTPHDPASRVEAVLATARGVLFDHPEGLGLVHLDGSVEVVVPRVDVVALGPWPGTGLVWAGTRGGPLLLVSDDDGLTWTERGDGLGFSGVHALAADPHDPERAVVGGSGLADGTGNAGTQRTDDLGATWQVRQDRLSNTHVFALAARSEPLHLRVRLAGTGVEGTVALPVSGPRWYAGTNGSGVATYRPDVPALTALAALTPYLRLVEPLAAGALLLVCVLPAYRRLEDSSPHSPPRGPARPRPADADASITRTTRTTRRNTR